MLISSAGGYLPKDQEPFNTDNPLGDYTMRRLPTLTSFKDRAYAHNHYDHKMINQDPQVAIPLRHLEDLEKIALSGPLRPL
jgi:hypothetical protein